MHSVRWGWLVAGAILGLASCGGPPLDITTAVAVTGLTTGWYDAGVENGRNKLLPTVTFRLRNVSALAIRNVRLNAVYRLVGESEEWGGAYTTVLTDGLAPGATSAPIVLRSNLGYTSTEPRAEMLRHTQFKDANVKVFAKGGSAQYALLGEWDIQRVLMVATSTQ
jgi:hypothetical protein